MTDTNRELIKSESIEDGAITNTKLAPSSITMDKLHPTAIGGIPNDSIDTQHLKDYSVKSNKIYQLSVTNEKISSNAITTDKINNNAIESSKIKDESIIESKLATNSVTSDKIKNGSITIDKIDPNVIKTIEDNFFDKLYPIGKGKYIQFTNDLGDFENEEDPNNKFPNTIWEQIFDEEGVFFRTEWTDEPEEYYNSGSLVPYRVDGLSEDKMQRLYGATSGNCHVWYPPHEGVFEDARAHYGTSGGSGGSPATKIEFRSELSSNAKVTASTDGRTEPRNRLLRIWLRTG